MDSKSDKIAQLEKIVEELEKRLSVLEKHVCPCSLCKICNKQHENIYKCRFCDKWICSNCTKFLYTKDDDCIYSCYNDCEDTLPEK